MNCAFCGGELNIEGKVSRSDTCPKCRRDLRCCKQCRFYDPGAYNECREVSADRIVDKERANFCDYFVLKGSAARSENTVEGAKEALEALFRK